MYKLYLRLDEIDVRDLAELLESRHGTGDLLVGKLQEFADQGATMGKPLEVTYDDIQTLLGMFADEPFLKDPAFRHLPDEIEKAIIGQA